MAWTFRYRPAIVIGVLIGAVVASTASAPAEVDMVVGARHLVANAPLADCSTKAKAALNSVLINAFETGTGTGEWLGYGPPDANGHATAAAAIHCYPIDTGYVVTITCAVQLPPNPITAADLCAKLDTALGATTAASATPAHS
ncbi:MAG TPA: hypothetical protein VNG31_00635 [Candidatus Baltobacteraceae bacterium]|nr:hypothetical protein [Candidatus Baltobacteraceae bacterium]